MAFDYPSPSQVSPNQYQRPAASPEAAYNAQREKDAKATQLTQTKDSLKKSQDKVLEEIRLTEAAIANRIKIIYDEGSTFQQKELARIELEQLKDSRQKLGAEFGTLKSKMNNLDTEIKKTRLGASYNTIIKDLTKNSTKDSADVAGTSVSGTQPTLSYEYNLPMVNYAYMSLKGPQAKSSTLQNLDPGTLNNADNAWTASYGSKGVIQASRHFPRYAEGGEITQDETVYGFKFHYNPTTVNMGWSIDTSFNIAAFMAGTLTSRPITDVGASTITFSIILNRIFDMNHINSNGTVVGSPYTGNVANLRREAKSIYERGTMYDLEYLFKTVNGKNVTYNSSTNGKTADLGWMMAFPVEVHLGQRLRYVCRIVDLQVQHRIFNERMVPIFSVVDLVCKRLPDPAGYGKKTTKSGGGTVGGNGRGFEVQ